MEAGGMLAGRYRLVAPVARGAQGAVWRAVDTHGGTEVAVKVSGSADLESLLRLVCEQSVRLGHPHVLTPVDWFVREGEAWLVLPLVRGGTLAGLLADYGELPVEAGLLIAQQLMEALAAVHGAGLVHRDVKPSNLLLAASGPGRPCLYLSDFGLARVLPHLRLTSTRFVAGTPDYLAPEVRAGSGGGPEQDVYAAGLVLRELGAPAALVAAMTADAPGDRPTAREARDELARRRAASGPERWPVLWDGEPFLIPDQFTDEPLPPVEPPRPAAPASTPSVPAAPAFAPAFAQAAAPPAVRRRRGRMALGAAVLGAVALTAAAMTAFAALTSEAGAGGTPAGSSPTPVRTVPPHAEEGPPDPSGPAVFAPCAPEEALAVSFSPEGYLLVCDHVPATARYEWTPQFSEEY
ncbi:serine/threonine-protein kinase [Streptomyces wedmorensis]|uniref:non-specific serine/threonine protein kinase n=1 Tax=Streptomyces wedmorensis TaxID=43759 RepID=A0ABW6IN32_STRWE